MDMFYPIKHWLFTLLMGALSSLLNINFYKNDSVVDFLQLYLAYLFVSALYSLPVLVVYFSLFPLVCKLTTSTIGIKSISNLLVIICVVATFALGAGIIMIYTTAAYCIAVIIASLFIKLEPGE